MMGLSSRSAAVALLGLGSLVLAGEAQGQERTSYPEYPSFSPGATASADRHRFSLVVLDRFEVAPVESGVPASLDGFWRFGSDYTRIWLRAEGEARLADGTAGGETQALLGRLISPYFDFVGGLRLDMEFEEGEVRVRPLIMLGLEGLAPFWFEVEPALFLSNQGALSLRLQASYDLLVTQRFVAQPEAEVDLAVQRVEEWNVNRGLNRIEAGLRVRYEIVREFAPYVGVNWSSHPGERAGPSGESTGAVTLVVGFRVWR